ncbi:hypothetical protein BD311DRAFT_418674 [Dichomitus squalens]|uniref:Uncharacterized protein n=1 Tax=Dichomitus squalens TaxID=114155 RepID=A0A4Q9ML66_9APHY|nr:hypothetical protein BD311DRAFT_418674 [Dichomitus squalens]
MRRIRKGCSAHVEERLSPTDRRHRTPSGSGYFSVSSGSTITILIGDALHIISHLNVFACNSSLYRVLAWPSPRPLSQCEYDLLDPSVTRVNPCSSCKYLGRNRSISWRQACFQATGLEGNTELHSSTEIKARPRTTCVTLRAFQNLPLHLRRWLQCQCGFVPSAQACYVTHDVYTGCNTPHGRER